ncbi:MAG: hypothetical protein PVG79_04670 [Gemmatimonadales bacterium]|jgi:hypothetical protein
MKTRNSIYLAAVLALTSPLAASGQQARPIAPGERIRVSSDLYFDPLVGTLTAIESDTLMMAADWAAGPATVRLPLASVTRLEVSRGRGTKFVQGALLGGALGAALGAIEVAAFSNWGECWGPTVSCANDEEVGVEHYLGAMAIGGAIGAGIGGIIGLMIGTDRWETLPLGEIRIGPAPGAQGGVAARLAMRI